MAVGDIVISVSADVSPLQAGVGKGVTALAAMEKSGKALEAQLKKIGEAGVQFQAKVKAFAGASDSIAKSARDSASAFAAFDDAKASVDRLRASYDPLFAASQRYEAALKELDAALEMGVISGRQHAQMVDGLGQAYLGAGAQLDRAHGTFMGIGNVSDQTRGKIQQVGFQVQDFAVQVGAGTSATQAFAQQFPQLAGAFGPVGVAVGTLAAIGIPLLVAAFGSAGEAAGTFEQSLGDVETALSDLRKTSDAFTIDGLSKLREEYGELNIELLRHIELQRQIDMRAAIVASQEAAKGLREEMAGWISPLAGLQELFPDIAGKVNLMYQALERVEASGTFEGQVAALTSLRQQIIDATGGVENMTAEQFKFYQKVQDSLDVVMRLNAEGNKADTWLEAATSWARDWARALWDAAGGAKAANDAVSETPVAKPFYIPRGMPGRGLPATGEPKFSNAPDPDAPGGGGGENPLFGDLARLRDQLATQAELEQQAFDASQETLEAALARRLITSEEYQANMERLQAQHQQRMAEIDVGRYGDGAQQLAGYLGVLADTFQSGNERMQKMGRVFGAAEALINAWRAYSQTIADPRLPFFAKFAAGAAVLSAGMNAVNAIKSGSSSARSAATPSASSAAASAPLEVRLTGFGPQDLISGDMVGKLFDRLRDEAGDRGVNIMVAA
jgi:hypothetical protein